MSSDTFVLSEAEQSKALAELEVASAPAPLPAQEKDKRLILRRIATDTAEPFHVRSEAQHILDIGDVRPSPEFNYRFREFMESYESNQ